MTTLLSNILAGLTSAFCTGAIWLGLDYLSDKKPSVDLRSFVFGIATALSAAMFANPVSFP